jgi:signal recognition particle subunit SRP54
MFDNLSDRLNRTIKNLRGQGRLTEKNISDSVRDVRRALLEADVALPVVQSFIEKLKQRAVGVEVAQSLSPGQEFIKIVHDELANLMGGANETINLKTTPPAIILLAGLQGAGKTTTAGKLAHHLINRDKKNVAVVSVDVYRPAAIQQLETLAGQVGAKFIASSTNQAPVDIAKHAIDQARREFVDVLIIDTAGRLHIDETMMAEISAVHQVAKPVETLFVVDSMTGQDAANTAQAFNEALALTGVILTKADGDARGGAALSVREITGKPIKFIGMGEKVDALEPFYPDRIASRILDMGDMLSLIEEVERKVDKDKAQKMARKIKKGVRFTFNDFREQLVQMRNMGGLSSLVDKLPGMGQVPDAVKNKMNDKELVRMEAMINSMTKKERLNPDLIRGSRKKRICNGSGTTIQDLNRLLKQFKQMQTMMKKMKGGNMQKMMRMMPGMGGGKLPFGGGKFPMG